MSKILDRSLMAAIVLGVILSFWGVVFDMVAVAANDGVMPVKTTMKNFTIQSHVNPRLYWLTDIWTVNFSKWPESKATTFIGKNFNYPVEGGLNVVSIGDVMFWVGSLMLYPMLIPFLIRLYFKVRK